MHYPGAVDLDGLFHSTQFRSDLLVETSPHDLLQHLPLARRQGVEPPLERMAHAVVAPLRGVDLQRLIDGFEQPRLRNGFGQEIDCARTNGGHRHRDAAVTGEEDDRHVTTGRIQHRLDFQTVELRHRNVQQHAAPQIRVAFGEKLGRCTKGANGVASRTQQPAHRKTRIRVVIDDKNVRARIVHWLSPPMEYHSLSGRLPPCVYQLHPGLRRYI